jgi:hypothetical protein
VTYVTVGNVFSERLFNKIVNNVCAEGNRTASQADTIPAEEPDGQNADKNIW